MLLPTRFPLSLVVALVLSPMAVADSAPVTSVLQPSIRTENQAYAGSALTSTLTVGGTSTPAAFTSFNNAAPVGGSVSGIVLGGPTENNQAMHFSSLDSPRNNLRFRTPQWNGPQGGGHGLASPEPGSLLLLSTGLIGIAGMIRRKLRV